MSNKKGIDSLIQARLSRRQVMQYGLATVASSTFFSGTSHAYGGVAPLQFKSIPVADLLDTVEVPEGYSAEVFYRWGDPISDGPEFKMDGSNTAEEQLQQAGMHHDAMQFYAFPADSVEPDHGLLVMNHEYIDPQLLHADGGDVDTPEHYSFEKVLKEQYAHGISVIELAKEKEKWQIVRPSVYARRITAVTAMSVSGPAAGSDYLKTSEDPLGLKVLGTFNNCSNGQTPWGTYLSCEENFNYYFNVKSLNNISKKQQEAWRRYGLNQSYYSWHKHDPRFELSVEPHEANRFGWVIEFDPYQANSSVSKRTALGRFSHENVAYNVSPDGRIACYSGDDAQFEHVYKFISKDCWDGTQGAHHGQLLDEGILLVAKFNEEGSGEWLPLVFGQGALTVENGFESQADVLVHARMAADAVGATPMDRPEWITTHPDSQDIYISMTNNTARGKEGKPAKNGANPRNNNQFGHIIKIVEPNATSRDFQWDVLALASNKPEQSTLQGDLYANPDGMMIDKRGILWLQTDISESKLNSGEFKLFGNNQMLAVDLATGQSRRFLTGPVGCEVTGMAFSPDFKTLWVNIQHPGDVPKRLKQQGVIKSSQTPNAASNWPDHQSNGRPRSATVMITKKDGGEIGR